MSRLVMLRCHGPAVQMDVYRTEVDRRRNNVWYSVDVVLSYEAKLDQRKRTFVAKPLISIEGAPQVKNTWRLSFSLEEKELFDGMDRDNGCRKKVLRILKVVRNREAGLKNLTSYHLKTALFYEMKEVNNWRQSELGPRLIGVLRRLYRAMEQGCQPHYIVPHINLLGGMKRCTIENIRDRLERIVRLEYVFTKLFRASNGDEVECEGEYGGVGGSRACYNDDEDFGAGYDDVGEIG
ncbi:Cyclic GMP-AMP synthase, partial [Lamellibrachia satsuma]